MGQYSHTHMYVERAIGRCKSLSELQNAFLNATRTPLFKNIHFFQHLGEGRGHILSKGSGGHPPRNLECQTLLVNLYAPICAVSASIHGGNVIVIVLPVSTVHSCLFCKFFWKIATITFDVANCYHLPEALLLRLRLAVCQNKSPFFLNVLSVHLCY